MSNAKVLTAENGKAVKSKAVAKKTAGAVAAERREVALEQITALDKGPRVLKTYMDACVRCGTCASVCPVYYGKPEPRYNPVVRSDLIRSVYKKHCTTSGKLLGSLVGAQDIDGTEMENWSDMYWECTGCRRCAQFCPMGIDNSVITRKGRGIVNALGLTPETIQNVVRISLETGNTDNASAEAFRAAIEFLEEEMQDEHGEEIKIPVDQVGAKYFYVPPSGDVLVNIEATMGLAKIFHVLGMTEQWTMSSKCFDGANYGLFNGSDPDMKADNKPYIEEAKRLECKVLLMGECGHAHRIMKMMMEPGRWWGDLPFSIQNCMEWTADLIQRGKLKFDKSKNPEPVTYHDPCNFAKSCGIHEEPRVIMKACCEDFREMQPHGPENWCCGGGGGLSAMDSIREFRMTVTGRKKLDQIKATGAKYVAAACSNCKRQLTQLSEYHEAGFAVGGVHDVLSRSILIHGKAAERTDYEG